jgi:predicted transcriptional regulator of viral defense system
MPRLNRFQIMQHVKPLIIKYLKSQSKCIFSFSDLAGILKENRETWTLPNKTSLNEFIKFLVDRKVLDEINIELPTTSLTKYGFGEVSIYDIALSINKNSYLSHYTAVFLHGLTENIPKTIYTNMEQYKKISPLKADLVQENIDRAFSRPMRETNQIARVNNYNIYLLNGKNLDRIGVEEISLNGAKYPVSGIERTLIDIAVRPNYSGGVEEVLSAYVAAKGKFSVNRLVSMLKKMDYIYPYHQAIGFYLERAGYNGKVLKLLEKIEIKNNFYLTYQIKDKDFSERWKLFFPKGL